MNSIFDNINEQRAAIQAKRAELDDQAAKLDQIEALARQLFPLQTTVPPWGERRPAAAGASVTPAAPPAAPPTITKREQIYRTVEAILADGKRRTSRELVPLLLERGVDVGGTDPVNNLSAYLSGAPAKSRFVSDRKKGGWTINTASQKASPRDVSPSQGLFSSTGLVEGTNPNGRVLSL